MLNAFLSLMPPMLLGAQLILTLVLIKGEICPGQRGRVHKVLPVFVLLWLASASQHIEALVVAAPVAFFYSQVQTNKTRVKGPLWALHTANLFAILYIGHQLTDLQYVSAYLSGFLTVLLLGGAFAHLNLKVARSRLEAFHKILPFSGVLSAILLVLTVSLQSFQLDETLLQSLAYHVFTGIGALLMGSVVWCWHLIRSSAAEKVQLCIALLLMLVACGSFQPLFLV